MQHSGALVVDRAGSGVPLVMVHGMGASRSTWAALRAELASGPLAVETVAIDLPGHGDSPPGDDPQEYTRDRVLDHLDRLLADIGRPVVLVGHSLGGYLSLAYVASRPDAAVLGVVVLNTGPGFRDADKREAWNARSRRNWQRFGVAEPVAEMNLQFDSVVMDRVAEIQTPVLFLAGGADRPEYTNSGEYLQRKMPSCRLVVIPDGEHSMHESQPAVVAAAMSEFVAAVSD